ncbi:MAG: hypothetical protein WKG32_20910 [Gemmatimonadaceae bacterium]
MTAFFLALGTFLLEHGELVNALMEAIEGGTTKEELMKAIRVSMVAASDEQMKRELSGRT